MDKYLRVVLVLMVFVMMLCGCEKPEPKPDPTENEGGSTHTHAAASRENDENYHYDICQCGERMNQEAHSFAEDWVLVKGGDGCDDYKFYVKDCTGCHFQISREEEPSGHDFVDYPGKEPTCAEDGYYPYTACTKCGLETSSKEVWPATGSHTYNNDGKCTNCGALVKGSSGLEMTLSADGKYYIVTNGVNCTDRHVVIPVEYKGKPVRAIGENAFTANGTMHMITFYGNVKTIEANAFMGCWNMENVQFMEGLEFIGESAFARMLGDANLVIGGLPDSLEHIGDWAFMGTHIFDLDLPKNVSHIGQGAFECTMLLNATCDTKNKTFYSVGNCLIERSTGTLVTTGYGSIEIPNDGSIKRIANCALSNVGAEVLDYYLPASLTYIEPYAFSHENWSITVHFAGTRAQWEAIEKPGQISDNMENLTVICADEE